MVRLAEDIRELDKQEQPLLGWRQKKSPGEHREKDKKQKWSSWIMNSDL